MNEYWDIFSGEKLIKRIHYFGYFQVFMKDLKDRKVDQWVFVKKGSF